MLDTLSLIVVLCLAAPVRSAEAAEQPAVAAPQEITDAEVGERVRSYLVVIDRSVGAEQWQAVGERAVPLLESAATDPEVLPSRRAKAVEALSFLGGDRARRVVLELVRGEDVPFPVRASAINGAPRLLSSGELVRELGDVLERAGRVPVRAAAAEALARHARRDACGAVRARAAREAAGARRAFARALGLCGRAPARR